MVEIIGHGTILIVHTAAIMIVYTNKFVYIYTMPQCQPRSLICHNLCETWWLKLLVMVSF